MNQLFSSSFAAGVSPVRFSGVCRPPSGPTDPKLEALRMLPVNLPLEKTKIRLSEVETNDKGAVHAKITFENGFFGDLIMTRDAYGNDFIFVDFAYAKDGEQQDVNFAYNVTTGKPHRLVDGTVDVSFLDGTPEQTASLSVANPPKESVDALIRIAEAIRDITPWI